MSEKKNATPTILIYPNKPLKLISPIPNDLKLAKTHKSAYIVS